MAKRVRMAIIGCGGMGRNHLRNLLKQTDTTEIVAFVIFHPNHWLRQRKYLNRLIYRCPRMKKIWMSC